MCQREYVVSIRVWYVRALLFTFEPCNTFIYCRTRNFRVCLYIAYLACGSASLYIKTLYFFLTVLSLSAAAIVANIKIRYDAKLPNSLYLGHA